MIATLIDVSTLALPDFFFEKSVDDLRIRWLLACSHQIRRTAAQGQTKSVSTYMDRP